MPRQLWIAAVLAALAPLAVARPQSSDLEADLARAEAELVPGLEELARWCDAEGFRGERDRLYAGILTLDPEHRAARRALRYFQVRRGEWRQSGAYRLPRDQHPERREELERLRAAVLEPYRARVFALVERHRAELGAEGVERLLRTLLALHPDDPTVRASLGEVAHAGLWILIETERSLERRRTIPFFARASLDAAPRPGACEPKGLEKQLAVVWSTGRATPGVRVLTTGELPEVEQTALVTHAVGDYFRNVFRAASGHRAGYTIYLLTAPGERERLLAAWPGLAETTRDALFQAAGGWLTANRLAEWSPDPKRRLDGAARQTLGTFLMDAYGIDGRQGWAWEGIGLYLVERLVGTKLTWFFEGEGYVPQTTTALWAALQDPTTDWFEVARELLGAEGAPQLAFLIGREVNAMREQDVLFAYVLAAFLLEGRPGELPALLRRLGAGMHPVAAFESTLGHAIPELERRLVRWLDETAELGAAAPR